MSRLFVFASSELIDGDPSDLWNRDRFIAFVGSRPGEEQYDFCDPVCCAASQFVADRLGVAALNTPRLMPLWMSAAIEPRPWNFEALLQRLKWRKSQ